MPLKVLHSLLEETPHSNQASKNIPCIGLSNWALDPAKMNRGIYMRRDSPDENELIKTAEGICSDVPHLRSMVTHLAKAYSDIPKPSGREDYYGLRDFYYLLKMLKSVADQLRGTHATRIVERIIRR